MNDLQVSWWPIDRPIPYSRNARKMPERRPEAKIDLVELEKPCVMQCTDGEVAAFFGVSTRTIERRRQVASFVTLLRTSTVDWFDVDLPNSRDAEMSLWAAIGKHCSRPFHQIRPDLERYGTRGLVRSGVHGTNTSDAGR